VVRRRRSAGWVPLAAAAIITLLIIRAVVRAISSYWPVLLLVAALVAIVVAVAMWMLGRVRAGRSAAAAERFRLDAIADTHRHRELSALDSMTGSAFEAHVANLCLRDGLRVERAGGGAGDLGADVIATTPDGRRVVIQCKRYQPHGAVSGPDMQRFLGTAHTVHRADVAVVVTTAQRFTRQAQELAVSHRVILINRDRLALWNTGSSLIPFLDMPPVGSGVRTSIRTVQP
jgi:restriction system protein